MKQYLVGYHIATQISQDDDWIIKGPKGETITFSKCTKAVDEIEPGLMLQEVTIQLEAERMKDAVRASFKLLLSTLSSVSTYFGRALWVEHRYYTQFVIPEGVVGTNKRKISYSYSDGKLWDYGNDSWRHSARSKIESSLAVLDENDSLLRAADYWRQGVLSRSAVLAFPQFMSSLEALLGESEAEKCEKCKRGGIFTDYQRLRKLGWTQVEIDLVRRFRKKPIHGKSFTLDIAEELESVLEVLVPKLSRLLRTQIFGTEVQVPLAHLQVDASGGLIKTEFVTIYADQPFPEDRPHLVSSRDFRKRIKDIA